jgi:hypothetical protein
MMAERGINLRLPVSSTAAAQSAYAKSFRLDFRIFELVEDNPPQLPQVTVKSMEYGRIESHRLVNTKRVLSSRAARTFDEHTAELVSEVSYRTGLAPVIARLLNRVPDGASTSIGRRATHPSDK